MLLSNDLVSPIWGQGALILIACIMLLGSQGIQFENLQKWAPIVARYVTYLLIIKGSHEFCVLVCETFNSKEKINILKIWKVVKPFLILFAISVGVLVYCGQKILCENFLLLFIGYLITKYPEMELKPSMINYGVGMACSFFEGYLGHIIPNDGSHFVGFQENINSYEAKQGVVFPVKRLFIVITKSLYCPPDLKFFNKEYTDRPYLEACQVSDQSLEDVEKDVAGVKNRTYRNSAYKIYRKNKPPVYLAAECATPLHTLHKVLQKKALYEQLADVDPKDIVNDFCTMLYTIIQRSPDCRDKCELVYFDDTDPNENLADVLLNRIREIEGNFEDIISKRR